MGTLDLLPDHLKAAALPNSSRILVVASPLNLEVLAHESSAQLLPGHKRAPLGPGEAVPAALFAGISLVVIEVDPNDRASIGRVGAIRERHPSLALVAAIRGASVSLARTLVREGISDVVSLPFELTELLQVSLDVLRSVVTGLVSFTLRGPFSAADCQRYRACRAA